MLLGFCVVWHGFGCLSVSNRVERPRRPSLGSGDGLACPATMPTSFAWAAGDADTGLFLAVDGTTGCFTVAVGGELWLASSQCVSPDT